jgi:hypothetical protein
VFFATQYRERRVPTRLRATMIACRPQLRAADAITS